MTRLLHSLVMMVHLLASPGAPVVVQATAYTCEPVAANPMQPCGLTRWGSDPATPGMACPPDWRGLRYYVPGHGLQGCDDTGRYNTLGGIPHIDIRTPTLADALAWGNRRITIYRIDPPVFEESHDPVNRYVCRRPVGPCRDDDRGGRLHAIPGLN